MGKPKMLIVDDSLFNRQVLTELFDAEFEVTQAGDGAEAMAALGAMSANPPVMLLDIVMPRMDGLDVLRAMQANGMLRAVPVIVTSSAGDDAYRLKALELGATDYISAPFNPILARLRVKSALASREYDRLRLQNEMLRVRRDEAEDYRALLSASRTAVLEFDAAGAILRYDATVGREIAGTFDTRPFLDVLSQDGAADEATVAALRRFFQGMIANEDALSDECDALLRTPGGERAWFRLRLLRKAPGEPGQAAFLLAINNIDRQKREEEDTRAQLIRALNAAESANAAKSEFLTRLSYEASAPLKAARSYLDAAWAAIGSPERALDAIGRARSAIDYLTAISSDVADISAIESGSMTAGYESFNLKELVNAVTAIIYPPVHKKNIQLQISLDGVQEERLVGDRARLSQILLNLLGNAVRFTPQNGEISLAIRQRPTGLRRVLMEFAVKDNGVGMARDFVARLEKPMEKPIGSRSLRGGDLGMAITKGLVSLLNGAMTVDSAEGRGSSFTVSLPIDVEQVGPGAGRTRAFAAAHVLVIDRDAQAAEHTRACFRGFGCRCDCSTSGRDALRLCAKNDYTLVLMDWKMPDLDGESIIAAIRQSVDSEPAIVVMAYDRADVSHVPGEKPTIVAKPVFPSTVLDLLVSIYGKYPVAPAPAGRAEFAGKRVLLAEDNPINREIAKQALGQMGFAVECAPGGLEAEGMFAASAPEYYDAVLMDIQMPRMNGYEAARRIRSCAHPEAATVPILAMTADTFDQDAEEARKNGIDGCIAKPIDMAAMRATLAEHLGV